jgi:hypothetical protein
MAAFLPDTWRPCEKEAEMNRSLRYLAPIVAVAMLGGCGLKEKFKDADAEVARFHAALDAERWQWIWDMTGPSLRETTKQADFQKILQAVHRKLGKVKASKQVGWNANASTSGSTLTVTTQTTFERGSGTEEFVFAKDADQPLKLAGYHINSQEMMLN